jgi:putative membrane protein
MSERVVPSRPAAYIGLSPDELILRDRLAIDRTILANERTLLSYARTALALLIAGLSLMHLPYLSFGTGLDTTFYAVAGWLCVGVGVVVVIIGYVHYRKYRNHIRAAGTLYSSNRQDEPGAASAETP